MRSTLTLIVAIVCFHGHPALALVGGPFGFNDPQGNQTGIYQATIQLKNGSGICRFSEGQEAQISVFNTSSVFYKGIIYFGTCFGIVDKNAKRVTGQTNGRSDGFQSTTTEEDVQSGLFTLTANQTTNTVDGLDQGTSGVIGNCNTSWTGKITDTAPILEFEAEGIAYFFGDLDSTSIITSNIDNPNPIIGTGADSTIAAIQIIIDAFIPDGAGTQNPFDNLGVDDVLRLLDISATFRESNITNTLSSGGQVDEFPDLGVQVPIQVLGSQISFTRTPPVTNQRDRITGTGSGGFLF